ncbi:hypothetical protein ACJX0J_007736, partial [Zea mays]
IETSLKMFNSSEVMRATEKSIFQIADTKTLGFINDRDLVEEYIVPAFAYGPYPEDTEEGDEEDLGTTAKGKEVWKALKWAKGSGALGEIS